MEAARRDGGPNGSLLLGLSILVALNAGAVAYGFHRLGRLDSAIRWVLAPDVALAASDARAGTELSGRPDPRMAVVFYVDFDCDVCRASFPAFASIRADTGLADDIRWEMRVVSRGPVRSPLGFRLAMVAVCDGSAEAPWQVLDAVAEQPALTDASVREALVGLSEVTARCENEQKAAERVWASHFAAAANGIAATPVTFVDGIRIDGLVTASALGDLIEARLQLRDGGTASPG